MEIHVLNARVLSIPHPFQLEFDIDTALMPSTAHLTQSHAVISHQNREAALASRLHYVFILRLVTWLMSILEPVQFSALCHASFPDTPLALTLCDVAKDCADCKLILAICSRKLSHPLPFGFYAHFYYN